MGGPVNAAKETKLNATKHRISARFGGRGIHPQKQKQPFRGQREAEAAKALISQAALWQEG